jgi:hypothetical protein
MINFVVFPSFLKTKSVRISKTPWQGDSRINIQDRGGKAKPEQVKTVIKALHKLQEMGGE